MFSFILKWHKKIGISAALFVILLAVTGLMLNHSESLNLNTKFIQTEWLLDLYQIKPSKEPVAFNNGAVWTVQIGERLYFNEQEIAKDVEQLKGLITLDGLFIVAYDGQLTLATEAGEVVENLSGAAGVPAGMKSIGYDDVGNVIIRAAHGYYQVNIDELEWKEFEHLDATWSEVSAVPKELEEKLLKKYRGTGLTIERVLLDFHSGRIAGEWGTLFVDLMALLFISLAISGVWMWSKHR